MRIAITVNTSWNIYNFRSGLIRVLLAQGHTIIAVAPKDEFSQRLIDMGCIYRDVTMNNTGSNPIKDLKLYTQLKTIYREEKPDIIYQYTVKPNIYGSMAAKSLSIPVINNVSGLGTVFLNKGITPRIAKLLYRQAFQKVELVFFQNQDDRKDFTDQIKLPRLKTKLLPGSGINLSEFKSEQELVTTPFSFLMIARLILDKGIIEYLDAARELKKTHPEVTFQLLGQLDEGHARGLSASTLQTYIDDGSVSYLGTSDQVKATIEPCSCVVLPSYREGTPKTLLEASAMSKPIVTTDVPGCREVIIDGQNGYLCMVKNTTDLQKKLEKMLILDHDTLVEMGKAGRKLVEKKFDESIIINHYLTETYKILS